jgi:hypothetical protein
MFTKTRNELLSQFVELDKSLFEEKDALKRLEIKIELIHLKEELKRLGGTFIAEAKVMSNDFVSKTDRD